MLLGKRPRPPMKRTTSMSEITFDLNTTASDVAPVDPNSPLNRPRMAEPVGGGGLSGGGGSYGADGTWKQQNGLNGLDQRVFASFPARNYKRHSTNFVQTADFLRSCSLCRSSLVPGRDIYMYRGDTAFCSLECRQQQMNQDEKKEKKCLLASKKQVVASASGSKVSTKGDTLATL